MLKIFSLLKPYRLAIALVMVLVFIQAISQLFLPTLMADIVDKGITTGNTGYIIRVGGIMLLVAIGSTVCALGSSYFSARVSMGYGRLLRGQVFRHIQGFSLHEYDQFGAASLITRTTNDVTHVQMVIMMAMRMMLMAPLMMVGGIIMAISRDSQLSRVIVVVFPVIIVAVVILGKKGLPLFRAMQAKLDKLNLVLRENLTGIRVVRAFNRIEHEQKRFDAANRDLTDTAIRVNKLMAVAMPLMILLINLTSIAIIWFGSIRIDTGNMQVGDLMAYIQYMMLIMHALMMVSMMFVMLPRAAASVTRVNAVLNTIPGITDPEQDQAAGCKGYIEFKNVSFSYPGAERPALGGISFSARPGEVTAIIGGTGAGKSTLVNLIPRFYDVDGGSVLVGGVDVRSLSQESLRSKVGYVPQQALLFSGTIAENIRYGKEDATEAEVHAAAETAQALDFIQALPAGFESVLAQGGVNLSGGQKQCLAIARALVRRPEIYIFDDSFSALDFRTDARLRRALRAETADSAVLIVAQRVTTVMDADRIIVLDNGAMVGMGSHSELMESNQIYREIVFSQVSEEEIA